MSDMPERIWAWCFMTEKQSEHMQGGWTAGEDAREQEYLRADTIEAQAKEIARWKELYVSLCKRLRDDDRARFSDNSIWTEVIDAARQDADWKGEAP